MRHSTFFFFFSHTKSFKSGMNATLTSHLTLEQINVKDIMAMCLVATRMSCTGLWDLWRKVLKRLVKSIDSAYLNVCSVLQGLWSFTVEKEKPAPFKSLFRNIPPVGMQTSTDTMENTGDSLKNWKQKCQMTQQSHCWAYTLRKPELKETCISQCSSQHYLQ